MKRNFGFMAAGTPEQVEQQRVAHEAKMKVRWDAEDAEWDAADLKPKTDKELADWHGDQQPGSRGDMFAEHEWQRRISDRQIAAARAANWRSIIGGITGTLLGVALGWWLSSESRNPPLNQRSDIPVQAQRETGSKPGGENPVATPPPKEIANPIPGAAKKRNWLKMAPKLKRKGNAVEITEEYMLSGPNGWLRDVYGQSQLEGGGE